MICVSDHKPAEANDPWNFLGPKRMKLLDDSWAGLFRDELVNELPVEELFPFFSANQGRPTKDLQMVLGVLAFQQAFDLTDEETIFQLAFNLQWHYALNLTNESDAVKYMCPKTLWNMRKILIENGLEGLLFDRITFKLIDLFKINTDNQRIDSVQIKSNMRRLGRIGIFSKTIHKFLVNLERDDIELFNTVDKIIIETYLSEKSLSCFSMVKPSDASKTLKSVSNDLFNLVQSFKDCPKVKGMESYKLLERVLKDHCNLTVTNNQTDIEIKKPKEISSDSLQNPSDPDAGYSGHKGQGYQVQIIETYSPDEESEEKSPNFITYVHTEPANESDADALLPAIDETQEKGVGPKKVLGDSLYGSDENCQKAAERGVNVVSPVMGSPKNEECTLGNFEYSDDGDVVSCPEGNVPVETKRKKSRFTAVFDCQCCKDCEKRDICPVTEGKSNFYLRYTQKQVRIAKRRAYEKTEKFKDQYRWRAGVEATMSEYDRKTGVKRLRVRGLKQVRYCAVLKALAVNIFRANAARNAAKIANNAVSKAKMQFFRLLFRHMSQIYSMRLNLNYIH